MRRARRHGHPLRAAPRAGCSSRAASRSATPARILRRRPCRRSAVPTGPDADSRRRPPRAAIPSSTCSTARGPSPSQAAVRSPLTPPGGVPGPPTGSDELKLAYVGSTATTSRGRFAALLGGIAGCRRGRRVARGLRARSPRPRAARARRTPREAGRGAHAVYTDVWVSTMGDRGHADERPAVAAGARPVPDRRRSCWTPPRPARSRCTAFPPHPGEEITAEVLHRGRPGSGSGTRPRTAGTRRRRCSNGCSPRTDGGSGDAAAEEAPPGAREKKPRRRRPQRRSRRKRRPARPARREGGEGRAAREARSPRSGAASAPPPRARRPRPRATSRCSTTSPRSRTSSPSTSSSAPSACRRRSTTPSAAGACCRPTRRSSPSA